MPVSSFLSPLCSVISFSGHYSHPNFHSCFKHSYFFGSFQKFLTPQFTFVLSDPFHVYEGGDLWPLNKLSSDPKDNLFDIFHRASFLVTKSLSFFLIDFLILIYLLIDFLSYSKDNFRRPGMLDFDYLMCFIVDCPDIFFPHSVSAGDSPIPSGFLNDFLCRSTLWSCWNWWSGVCY